MASGLSSQQKGEEAKDPVYELLGDLHDDNQDEDKIDLAALRQAVAAREAADQLQVSDQGAAPQHPASDPASEEGADSDDALHHAVDEILSPELQPAGSAPSSEGVDDTTDVEESTDEVPSVGMQRLVKDVVVSELLQQSKLTLPQALHALGKQAEQPIALWRLVADLPDVDRAAVFEQAANLQGFPAIPVSEEPSSEFIQTVLDLLAPPQQESLFTFNLLPLKLKIDPLARKHSLLLASHDPSHPDLRPFLEGIGMPTKLFYAPEDVIKRQLKRVWALVNGEDGADGSPVVGEEDPKDETTEPEQESSLDAPPRSEEEASPDDEAVVPVEEIIDLSEDADFLELIWEPFTSDDEAADAPAPPEQPGEADDETSSALLWKPLAEFEAMAQEEVSESEGDEPLDELPGGRDRPPVGRSSSGEPVQEQDASTELLMDDEMLPKETTARYLLEDLGIDDEKDIEKQRKNIGPPSFDGSSVYMPDGTPIPDVSDWTQRRGDVEPPAVEPPAVEPPAVEPPAVEPPSEEAIDETASVEPEAPTVEAEPDHSEEFEEEVSLLSEAELKKIKSKDRVVGILLKKGIVTTRDIKRAQRRQEDEQLKEPLWRVLTLVSATRNEIFAQAANVYAFKAAVLGDGKPDPDFARSVMDTFDEQLRDSLLKLRVVPFEVDLDPQTGAIKVVFITHDPTRPEVHRMMQKLKLERFELRYAPEKDVKGLILEAFPRKNEFLERLDEEGGMAFDLGASYDEQSDLIDEDALEAEISRSKLINLFEATLVEAVRQEASDVHIWPNARKQVEIHFRIDGRLQRWHVEDKIHPEALIAVIKDNSINVDRFERDAAQDGFIQRWIDEALIRFRVSVLPIANAAQDVRSESIVIRVLDDRKVIKDLRQLGLDEVAFQRFRKAISQPHGMVILTGPTGSGKTTTLYASLHEVVSPEVNVLTVEDPVEYILPGVRQIKLNNKLGLEGALRSILRHDPDVVMVGEMRDRPTAELAIKLANTGHLTFSTLHTNDAASAVSRLYKMGIEPFLIAYAINLVVAQRLIRRLCRQCKKVDLDPDHVLLKNLGFSQEEIAETTFYTTGHDENCPVCKGLGFKGRRAVSEAMYFSREIRHMIADSDGKLDEQEIKALGVKQGMMTLQDSAREVVKTGDTSVLEMLRVVSSDD